jgi:hypothetical protein
MPLLSKYEKHEKETLRSISGILQYLRIFFIITAKIITKYTKLFFSKIVLPIEASSRNRYLVDNLFFFHGWDAQKRGL